MKYVITCSMLVLFIMHAATHETNLKIQIQSVQLIHAIRILKDNT